MSTIAADQSSVGHTAIDILPNDVLLEVFDFCTDEAEGVDGWHLLVHICQRWRSIVFASPRRLKLQLLCADTRPVRGMLDIWPTLPIIIRNSGDPTSLVEGADNIIAALEHNDRVCQISLGGIPGRLLERFVAVAHEPFPELTDLALRSNDEMMPALPNSFMGGSAPHLRTLWLIGIPFPALRELLLSAHDIVHLDLSKIPNSGYISPDVMVTCLAALTRLELLQLGFRSPRSRPPQAGPRLPLTRSVLPALTSFYFKGVSEYVEDLVSRIDAPLLHTVEIKFFHQLIFVISQLPQFISRIEKFKALSQAHIIVSTYSVDVKLTPQTGTFDRTTLMLGISCGETDWQLSSMAQLCSSSLHPLTMLEHLNISTDQYLRPQWQEDIDNTQWLEVLHPFPAVKNLYLSEDLALRVAPTLKELAEEAAADVLPTLQSLFLEGLQSSGPVQEAIGHFVTARQLSDHPVTVDRWERG